MKKKTVNFYESSTKPPPYSSQLIPVIGDESLYLQQFEYPILTCSLTAYECKSSYTNGPTIYKSGFKFIPLEKNMSSL